MPEVDISNIFIENLKKLIKENKMTNAEFAEKIGVRPSTVSMWMRGTNLPRMELLDKIADLFGVTVGYLTSNDKNKIYINSVASADISIAQAKLIHYAQLLQDLNSDELNDVQHYIEFVKSKRADTE